MTIGYIGLGKMGHNMVVRLVKHRHKVTAFDPDQAARIRAKKAGARTVDSLKELVAALPAPRLIWLMVPHAVVDAVLKDLLPLMKRGDMLIDGGNSFYEDTMRRAKQITKQGIKFMDIGTSGGPGGALHGACLMVGGAARDYAKLVPLFRDLAAKDAYGYMGSHGAGHFVKMIHNGIEYGMMQSVAEGFGVMQAFRPKLDLKEIARVYNRGSVVESRLVGWLSSGFKEYGERLQEIPGSVGMTGEGEWSVKTARKFKIPAPAMEAAVKFRADSVKRPSYMGKILQVMRRMFGGHIK